MLECIDKEWRFLLTLSTTFTPFPPRQQGQQPLDVLSRHGSKSSDRSDGRFLQRHAKNRVASITETQGDPNAKF